MSPYWKIGTITADHIGRSLVNFSSFWASTSEKIRLSLFLLFISLQALWTAWLYTASISPDIVLSITLSSFIYGVEAPAFQEWFIKCMQTTSWHPRWSPWIWSCLFIRWRTCYCINLFLDCTKFFLCFWFIIFISTIITQLSTRYYSLWYAISGLLKRN